MNELEKLRVLLPHWIEHNQGHAEECRRWAAAAGAGDVQSSLNLALEAMELVTQHLDKALAAAGGPQTDDGHHHHH
jgi:hypothetical protein